MPAAISMSPLNRLLENRAQSLFEDGQFNNAIEAAEAGVESARRLLIKDDPQSTSNLLDAMLVEADIRRHIGFLDAADGIYRDVLRLGSDFDTMRRQIAFARAGLGDIAEERGHSTDALRQYESAVRGLDTIGASVGEESARLRNNLALLYKDDNDYQAAEEHLVAGIQMLESTTGRYTQTVATLYSNLSAVYMNVGHPEQAKAVALIARDIRQQILPPDHPDIIQSLSNLGAIFYALDDYDAASQAFSQAITIMQENPNVDPHDYEVVVSNHIDLLHQIGQNDQAEAVAKAARLRYRELHRLRNEMQPAF